MKQSYALNERFAMPELKYDNSVTILGEVLISPLKKGLLKLLKAPEFCHRIVIFHQNHKFFFPAIQYGGIL